MHVGDASASWGHHPIPEAVTAQARSCGGGYLPHVQKAERIDNEHHDMDFQA